MQQQGGTLSDVNGGGLALSAAGTAAIAAAVEAEFGVVVLASVAESRVGPLLGQGPWPRRGQLALPPCCVPLLAGWSQRLRQAPRGRR